MKNKWIVLLTLLSLSPYLKADQKKMVKHKDGSKWELSVGTPAEVPCLYDEKGNSTDDFFKDFKNITEKSNKCIDGNEFSQSDPIWKARMYFTQMRKVSSKMRDWVLADATDFNVEKLKNLGVDLSKKIDSKNKTSSLEKSTKILGVAGAIPGMGVPGGLKAAKGTLDVIAFGLKIIQPSQPEYDLDGDLSNQLRAIQSERNDLVKSFQDMDQSFEDIVQSLGTNENDWKDLGDKEREILREIVCRFSPKKDGEIFSYKKFCSSQKQGQEDFNKVRGTLTCKDVNAISDENMSTSIRAFRSSFARVVASDVKFHDPTRLFPDGISSHFEIDLKKKSGVFASPGGNNLLCLALQDPRYDAYWNNENPRKLKRDLRIWDTGFPVVFKENNLTGPDEWYFAEQAKSKNSRGVWRVNQYINDSMKEGTNFSGFNSNVFVKRVEEDAQNPRVVDIVKEECNKKYGF